MIPLLAKIVQHPDTCVCSDCREYKTYEFNSGERTGADRAWWDRPMDTLFEGDNVLKRQGV